MERKGQVSTGKELEGRELKEKTIRGWKGRKWVEKTDWVEGGIARKGIHGKKGQKETDKKEERTDWVR